MPQGKLKTKVSVPKSAKKKGQRQSKTKQVLRKGGRVIAPKKQKLVEANQLKKIIQKAVNSGIEKELILTAGKNNCNLRVYKTEESNQQKPSTSTSQTRK